MGILIIGFIMAAVSYFSKSGNVILTAITVMPLACAFLMGLTHIMNDPSSVQQATNSIVVAFTSYFTGYLLGLPGTALFDAVKSIF